MTSAKVHEKRRRNSLWPSARLYTCKRFLSSAILALGWSRFASFEVKTGDSLPILDPKTLFLLLLSSSSLLASFWSRYQRWAGSKENRVRWHLQIAESLLKLHMYCKTISYFNLSLSNHPCFYRQCRLVYVSLKL